MLIPSAKCSQAANMWNWLLLVLKTKYISTFLRWFRNFSPDSGVLAFAQVISVSFSGCQTAAVVLDWLIKLFLRSHTIHISSFMCFVLYYIAIYWYICLYAKRLSMNVKYTTLFRFFIIIRMCVYMEGSRTEFFSIHLSSKFIYFLFLIILIFLFSVHPIFYTIPLHEHEYINTWTKNKTKYGETEKIKIPKGYGIYAWLMLCIVWVCTWTWEKCICVQSSSCRIPFHLSSFFPFSLRFRIDKHWALSIYFFYCWVNLFELEYVSCRFGRFC